MEKRYVDDSIRFFERNAEKACIQEKAEEGFVAIALSGDLSGDVSNTLLDEMTALVVSGQGIVIDMENTTYASPSVMEVFLRTEKLLEQKGKYLQITRMPKTIYDEFKARGLHELLEIEVSKNEL